MPVMYILVVLARQRILKLVDGNRKFLAIDKAIGENGFKVVTLLHLSPLYLSPSELPIWLDFSQVLALYIGQNGQIRLVMTTIWVSRGMIVTMKHQVSQTFLITSRYI